MGGNYKEARDRNLGHSDVGETAVGAVAAEECVRAQGWIQNVMTGGTQKRGYA